MQSMVSDVIGGYNAFLRDQKAQPGRCYLTLAQFDSQGYDTVHQAVPLENVPDMTPADFIPRGGTPLLDAIGRAVAGTQARADTMPEESQLVVILTDGQENQSREYTRAAIKSLIEAKEAQGWTFAYLGCDAAAYTDALSMGFSQGSTQTFAADGQGMAVAAASLSANTRNLRSSVYAGRKVDPQNFYATREAEEDAAKRGKAPAKR